MTGFRARDPIVLVHGILGFSEWRLGQVKADYFRGICKALTDDGNTVPLPPTLNPAGTIEERAADLKTYLENNDQVAGKQVHLIAHSMGGLDSRRLITKLREQDPVPFPILTLTTLGTPHSGTPVADLGTEALGLTLEVLLALGVDIGGFFDLTTQFAADFNAKNPDDPGVRYYFVAGDFDPALLDVLKGSHDLIGEPNDGLVPVSSAAFGQSLDTWPADHFRLINWGTNLLMSPAELVDMSIVENYRGLVGRLVADGY